MDSYEPITYYVQRFIIMAIVIIPLSFLFGTTLGSVTKLLVYIKLGGLGTFLIGALRYSVNGTNNSYTLAGSSSFYASNSRRASNHDPAIKMNKRDNEIETGPMSYFLYGGLIVLVVAILVDFVI